MQKKIRFGVVGLGFGANFLEIIKCHPNAELTAICSIDSEALEKIGNKYDVPHRFKNFEELTVSNELDAILIMAPVSEHFRMSKMALIAGKHVSCAVPMAENIDDCIELCEIRRKFKKVYMMFETSVYTRTFLYVKDLLETGKLGKIQFLRGSHQQNMSMPGWPDYWHGLPPMLYATHAVSPLLALANKNVESVICYGSGTIRKEYAKIHNCHFAIETAYLKLKDSDLVCEVTRSFFDTIRQYRESFDVYATDLSFEWEQISEEGPVVFSNLEDAERITIPDYGKKLPAEISIFTGGQVEDKDHATSLQGGGHGGSYPHMIHEFISAILENRKSAIDADVAANWTMTGLCAHQSAMNNGEKTEIPKLLL
jgi:predicted dehydrogenase